MILISLYLSCVGEETFSYSITADVVSEDSPSSIEDSLAFVSLPNTCDLGVLGVDPLTEQGVVFAQDHVFAELLDIAYDPQEQVVWSVGQGGLMVFDVENRSAPEFMAAYSPLGWHERAYHLVLDSSERLFMTHRNNGWISYDIRNPLQATAGAFTNLKGAAGMAYEEDVLYVATHLGSVYAYDVSGVFPEQLDVVSGLGNPWRMALGEDVLYVADNTLGLVTIDSLTPEQLSIHETVLGSGGLQDVVWAEGFVYGAAGGLGIDIFDASIPDKPQWIGNIPTSYPAIELAIDDDLLWVASQQDVMAIDVSNPHAPMIQNTEQTRQWAMAIDAQEGVAFVADWGYMSILQLQNNVSAGDLHVATTLAFVEQGQRTNIALRNFGMLPIELYGGTSSHPDIDVEVSEQSIASGDTHWLSIKKNTSDGGRICLSSSDPDTPQQYIDVVGPEEYPIGASAPDFSLTGLDGQIYRLQEMIGSYVVLVYFATW